MRYIEKDMTNPIARGRLELANYRTDVDSSIALKKGSAYTSAKYGHDIIRDELNDLYFDKCAFCETSIKPAATPNVEHFRPKASISGVNDNGYYWLGYEWSNLLLACPACNGAKGTKFPLHTGTHIINHPADALGNIDYAQFPQYQGYLTKERPLLINPEYWKPEKLMYFDYFCKLRPIKNNILAITTIEEIKLNRIPLIIDRQSKVDEIVIRIEQQICARYGSDPLTDNQYRYQLNLIFKDIISRLDKTAEYTLLGRCMIERFDEIILEDIEPEFHKEITDHFIDFLNNILI